jgi:hypothetical protein
MDEPAHDAAYRQRIAELIEKRDNARDAREMLAYTMRKHGRRARVYRDPEDYPNEAIIRTMDGRRKFDFDGEKTLMQHYQSVIDSLVSHDLEKAARHVRLADREDAEDGAPLGGYDSSRLVATDHTEQEVITKVDAGRHQASLPPEERKYDELRRSGLCKTAKDFSLQMCIPEKHVRNIERRIARRKRKRNDETKL